MVQHVHTQFADKVLHITLQRPDKYNSFIRPMALELQRVLREAAQDKTVRCLLITGDGKAFSAGQDLGEATDPKGPELTKIVTEHYNPIIQQLRDMAKPVVMAVNGVAAGAGANIALAGDIVLAAESATFIQAFSKIGLIPDSGGTYTLPRLIGWQKASALMMLGDKVSAAEAERMGMIYRTVADQELPTEAQKLAQRLSNMPTLALARTKQLLNESAQNDLRSQLAREDYFQTECGQSDDYAEGTQAFLEKRKPVFKGE
ncbi:MAG: enoyl-CoA hydratase-related protein [Schleiferiaceae bacterium]|jgi:2-(1,2-epoxy-1,2-dihydrophenyl)acetyl-CoA isomerase|nr:enoyl-CoA hydratase-related protein [Schleiferiaceae bacterium]MDR9441445.1 enoyl-CoA hydratase-related protein [Schleiferiaceae bacterium]